MESKEQLGTNGSFATSCFSIIVNFDPAAEHFDYPLALDIRELVNLDDVMEEVGLGPNGGLMYCMEYLEDNLDDWLACRGIGGLPG